MILQRLLDTTTFEPWIFELWTSIFIEISPFRYATVEMTTNFVQNLKFRIINLYFINTMFFFLKEIASILYQKLANQHIITFSNRKVWSFSCFLSPGSRFSFQHSALQMRKFVNDYCKGFSIPQLLNLEFLNFERLSWLRFLHFATLHLPASEAGSKWQRSSFKA